MTYKPVQILTPHSEGCRIQYGEFSHIWVCLESVGPWTSRRMIQRDLAGRKNANAGHPWLLFRCNDPKCAGQLIAYERLVMAQIEAAFLQEAPNGR